MTITIRSYLKNPDYIINDINKINSQPEKYFIWIDDASRVKDVANIIDLNYIEGVITIEQNGKILMDFKYWDLVDQLWGYWINLIIDFVKFNKAETFFPDQPIKLELNRVSNEIVLLKLISKSTFSWTLPKNEFFNALLDGANHFFEKMTEYFGDVNKVYKYEDERIRKLKLDL